MSSVACRYKHGSRRTNIKRHVYAIIALASFAGPLALSFDRRVYFIQYLLPTLIATVGVGTVYIVWDVLVTRAGHWRFNDATVGTIRILDLPPGEWLFFLLIPYACLFTYEVVIEYFGAGTPAPSLNWFQFVLAAACVVLAVAWRKRGYTSLAMISATIYFVASGILTPGIVAASGYLLSMLLSFVAFTIVNGLYTSIPTIFYNDDAILGVKAGTIPLEDFVYNLSYIGLIYTVYLVVKLRLGI